MELIKNSIKQYTQLMNMSDSREEVVDTIVSDVLPDAEEIICASAAMAVEEKVLVAGQVRVSGQINTRTFCATAEGRVFVVEGMQAFTYQWDAPNCSNEDVLLAEMRLMPARAELLNPRKVSVKAVTAAQIKVYRSVQTEYTGGVSSQAQEKVNILIDEQPMLVLSGITEKRLTINEEIRISSGDIAPGDRVFRSEVVWQTEDIKTLPNKIMLRGMAKLQVTTISESGSFTVRNHFSLPYSQMIEMEEVTEQISLEYHHTRLDAQLVQHQDGALFLNVSALCTAVAFARKQQSVSLLSDFYSSAYETSSEYATVNCVKSTKNQTLEGRAAQTVTPNVPAVKVLDWWVDCQAIYPSRDEGIIAGRFYIQAMYENVMGGICTHCCRVDAELPISGAVGNIVRISPSCEEFAAVCDEMGGIAISFKAVFMVESQEVSTCRQVKSCNLQMNNPKVRRKSGSLVLRNVAQEESVWTIAKSYSTSPEAILSANRLDNESALEPGKLILIPFA